jgi:shikimate kinase / 3-dehydroquinate synthase
MNIYGGNSMRHIFLYGPPGSGKSTVGKILAGDLNLSFLDLDADIERTAGKPIPQIMAELGEQAFRDLESAALEKGIAGDASVIALGGGALLREGNRACAESAGDVVLLEADLATLLERLNTEPDRRPLLVGDVEGKLNSLLERRKVHYDSFTMRVSNLSAGPQETAWSIQQRLGRFHVKSSSAGYDVVIRKGGSNQIGEMLKERGLGNPVALVSDSNLAPLYGERLLESLRGAGYEAVLLTIPAGEQNKTLETISSLWNGFLEAGLDRKSTVVALGGGVTGDLSGFAASTFMRGIAWVGVPTSLLAMVDSSMGGKTGFDLPYGKNLVGSFHSPKLVLADPDLLSTLPEVEFRSGLGEVVKHGIVADVELFNLCAQGYDAVKANLDQIVRRAMAVKIRVIEADPFEQGVRAALNLGHTVGHAVELASGFHVRHGEAVAIGVVVEARLAERLSMAANGLSEQIASALTGLGLPTEIPYDLPRESILQSMKVDKKKHAHKVRFSLPIKIGLVKMDVEVDDLNLIFDEA